MSSYKPIKQSFNTHEPDGGADASLPPIIFLHGVIASKETWKDFPQKVANQSKRKVYNVDLRNHGDSEWSDEFDMTILKKDVLHFMETINCPKASFIGHSIGAIAIIQMALEEPNKVEKVVINEMKVKKLDPNLAKFTAAFSTVAPNALPNIPNGASEDEAASIVLKTVCSALPPERVKATKLEQLDKTVLGLKKNPDGSYGFKANLNSLAASAKNVENILVEPRGIFNGPALFIYGNQSAFEIGKEIDHIKGHFPNAQFIEVNDAGHYVHHEKPQEFIDAVLKFF